MPITTQEVAAQDQMMARMGAMLDVFVARIRRQIAAIGEPQVIANTALAVTKYSTPGMNAELLLAAVMRLAKQEES